MVKIREDKQGLFAYIDGWICRPPVSERITAKDGAERVKIDNSKFQEGDEVRGSHPAGQYAYLRVGKRNASDYHMEVWDVTDLTSEAKGNIDKMNATKEVQDITGATKVDMVKLKKDLGLE